MSLSFENFYAFEFMLGIFCIIIGFNFPLFGILFFFTIVAGCIAILDSLMRWNKSQKTKESLEKLDLQRKNATLDFDIKDVKAQNDIEWLPEDVINGEPTDFKEICTTEYKINLMVYNPCVIENAIRAIEVCIPNRKKKADVNISSTDDVNEIPLFIAPRKYEPIIFKIGVSDMVGKKGDKLKITLITMDNKRVHHEYEIKYYRCGPNI